MYNPSDYLCVKFHALAIFAALRGNFDIKKPTKARRAQTPRIILKVEFGIERANKILKFKFCVVNNYAFFI